MAKLLAYQRDAQQVVTVDTINNVVANLGNTLPSADPTDKFGLRTRDLIAVYKGDPYILWRHSDDASPSQGYLHLAVLNSGVWTDVPGGTWTSLALPAFRSPTALHVVQDKLVMLSTLNNHGALDEVGARVSSDGTTWSAGVSLGMTTLPVDSQGGHSIVWRNAVWWATADGLVWYDPTLDAIAPAFDTGSDGNITGQNALQGNFAFWNNDLYFVMPGPALRLYKLASAWTLPAPPAAPAFTNVIATGLPSAGTFTGAPDVGGTLAFVGPDDALYLFYSAQLGTFLVRTTSSIFPVFADVTTAFVPSALRSATDIGISLIVDDRRRIEELMSFLFAEPAASGSTRLLSWDGVSEMVVRTTFASTRLASPDDRFGAQRIYTALQPTAHIFAQSAPFTGRTQLDYVVRDLSSRPIDVFGEYTVDGDVWSPMTQGDGDSGNEQLASSPGGISYIFYWDTWVDLDGDYPHMNMRIVARISGV